jgi:hypothetical protein
LYPFPCCWTLLPIKTEDAFLLMLDAVLHKVNREGREDNEDSKPSMFSVDFDCVVI